MKRYAIIREHEENICIHIDAPSPEDALRILAKMLFPQRRPLRINGETGKDGLFCYLVNKNGVETKMGGNYRIIERPAPIVF